MLVSLSIRDVVLIERLSVGFRSGLCVLTGETGAGKSILLDSLGLALGARADSGLVRHGAPQATVIAEFDPPPFHPALLRAREQGLEVEGGLVLRRQITTDGRSRAWVNDQPVSASLLRRIGEELVEVHGQFDTHGLLDPRTHRALLDAHAGLLPDAARVAAAWRAWQQVEAARQETAAASARARAEEDYLRHALGELESLAPQPGEESDLAARRLRMQQRSKLVDAMNAAYSDLAGDRGAERGLANAARHLTRAADRAGALFDPVLAALDRAIDETASAIAQLQSLSADADSDGESLDDLEERLFALRAVARKHSVTVEDLPALQERLTGRLALINDQEETLTRLSREAALAREAYLQAAQALSAARRQAAGDLDAAVAAELPPLKMERARFITAITALEEPDWQADGLDRIAFTVATNPGTPPGPLNRIASGGELARFMLALKVVLARAGTIPTLVFDEVDMGIGGAVAAAVGERLARLGREVQTLVITHSPQVAARGCLHLHVRKQILNEGMRTEIRELEPENRLEELARMLSGAEITPEARAAAQRLLDGADPSPGTPDVEPL